MRALLACVFLCAAVAAPAVEDHRAWQHGVNLLRIGNRLLVVWGSAGNPPRPNLGGDWQHDVYYAWLDQPLQAHEDPPIVPQVLVAQPEAQEPPSVAVNALGTVLMTTEDGNGGINQHAGMWDGALRVLRQYPFTIRRGGHSGHVAAMGGRFLVAYGEGWVPGGGFLDRGTGKDIHARIVRGDGSVLPEMRIASGHRDSWPLVAASDRNWLVAWQRYPARSLETALLDGAGKVIKRAQIAAGLPDRYAYDVAFAPSLAAYVLAGSSRDDGFVALVDRAGAVVLKRQGLPPIASESRIVLGRSGSELLGVYPVQPRGIAVLRLSTHAIELARLIEHPYAWDYAGTAGVFLSPDEVLFATLSTTGLRLIRVDLRG